MGIALGLATWGTLAVQAANPIAQPVQQFAKTLTPILEQYLQRTLQRQKFGVEVTPVVKGDAVQLQTPSHLERDTVFEVMIYPRKNPLLVKGRVLFPEEKQLLLATAQATLKKFTAEIEVHPFADPAPDFGTVKVAAADLYVKPVAQAGENLATQSRFGTPLKIIDMTANKQFYRVWIADDGYIAWIKASDVMVLDATRYANWSQGRNVVLLNTVKQGQDTFYLGSRFPMLSQQSGMATLALPSGKSFKVKTKDLLSYESKSLDPQKILAMSKQYLPQGKQGRVTYLWGGSIGNQLDCSGYVQTVFGTQNIFLPRDADQQKGFSVPVAETLNKLSELKPGDLIFFSGNRKYPTHVGIYIGNGQFIHSSPKGAYSGVKINTLRGGGEYDKMLQGIYFGGGRIVRSLTL